MKTFSMNLPDKMVELLNKIPVDKDLDFKRAAFLLYAYIDAGKMSHGRAAEILGVDKFDLIDFYGGYGIDYINYPIDKFAESEKLLWEHFNKEKNENGK